MNNVTALGSKNISGFFKDQPGRVPVMELTWSLRMHVPGPKFKSRLAALNFQRQDNGQSCLPSRLFNFDNDGQPLGSLSINPLKPRELPHEAPLPDFSAWPARRFGSFPDCPRQYDENLSLIRFFNYQRTVGIRFCGAEQIALAVSLQALLDEMVVYLFKDARPKSKVQYMTVEMAPEEIEYQIDSLVLPVSACKSSFSNFILIERTIEQDLIRQINWMRSTVRAGSSAPIVSLIPKHYISTSTSVNRGGKLIWMDRFYDVRFTSPLDLTGVWSVGALQSKGFGHVIKKRDITHGRPHSTCHGGLQSSNLVSLRP